MTPLHISSNNNLFSIVDLLINHGAYINAMDSLLLTIVVIFHIIIL